MATGSTRDDIRTMPPAIDYMNHERQYRRFLHLTKWFVIHALIMLVALYFFLIGNQPVTGAVFLAISVGAITYGIFTTASIRKDIESAMEGATNPSRSPE
jgi:hypothetical protein